MGKPPQRNSTRDREKAERVTLRSIVLELQAHLNALSTLTRSQLQSRHGGKSAWRGLAERQAHARKAAEQTNRVLNERVQSNADWIQRLWELLHEKRRATEGVGFKRMTTLQRKADDNLVLDQLKQQAQTAMTELPNVFAMHGEAQSTLVCVRRIPFDMHSTSTAVWTALSRPKDSFASESSFGTASHDLTLKARVVERTPSVCAMKVQDKMLVDSGVVEYHAVVCRSTLAQPHGASVFVWRSLFTLADGSVMYEDTIWAAVTRGPSDSMEAFVAIVSQSQLQTKAGFGDSGSIQSSVMPAVQRCVNSILSSTEDMLLDESLSKSSRSSSSSNSLDEPTGSITV